MATQVYKTLAKIVGIVLILAGIGAFAGGAYADSFIASQLKDQQVVLPTTESIDGQFKGGGLSQEDADALYPVAGQTVTTGDQARIFADHYIYAHMKSAVKRAGLEPGMTFATVGEVVNEKKAELAKEIAQDNPAADEAAVKKMVEAEVSNPLTKYETATAVAKLDSLRNDTLLTGNTIRGMLLNAYGWGLVGKVAKFAGIGLFVVGLGLTAYGFLYKGRNTKAEA
ncbi:hypothetical protein INS90_00130 [Trueperella pecoris]|uniref:Uncharacterized protein n=1 Tax=Trueperella pecoris TaxID=2733571 RepID=A0A7M1R0Y4_9ACTO|nr:hypothetical protein [Trueperella pecoris]QOR47761.1 hypothetical protein INS90_00130 [Trueperella pecoris]